MKENEKITDILFYIGILNLIFILFCFIGSFIVEFIKAIDNDIRNDIRCNETYYVDFDNNEGKADYCNRTLVCSVDGIKIQAKKVYYKNVCIIDKDTMKN